MIRQLAGARGSLSAVGAVVGLLQRAAPAVVESQSDAKGSLERELKRACEAFIADATTPVTRPLLALLPGSAAGGRAAAARPVPAASAAARPPPPSAAAVGAALTRAEAALDTRVRAAYVRMCGYLHEPATRAILYGPVKGAVLDACGQLQTLLHATGQAEEYEPRLRALAAKLEAIEAAPSQPAAEAPPPPQAAPIPEEAGE
jgi:hypothetical protein